LATVALPPMPAAVAPAAPGEVELLNISKRFGPIVAVDDVSLSVRAGEFLTLLGPSGCGKTTSLRLIGGFIQPTAGEVVIGGERMDGLPPYRRPVNTVFQNYALFPHLTVAQNIAYGLRMAGVAERERDQRVRQALDLVRLADVERRRPAELSGGQQQRIALARALINRPAVLLLDEPLGALDLKLRQTMQLELKHIQREAGPTFIYVTHDQDEAMTMADRVAVMSEGRVLQIGTPAEIYDQPRTKFVAGFIGENNFVEGRLSSVAGGLGVVELDSVGWLCGRLGGETVAGTKVTLAIRPERIVLAKTTTLVSANGSEWNELTGRVTDVQYLGTHWRVVVILASGRALIAHRQPGDRGTDPLELGDVITARFRSRDAIVLTD
jgi:spermidine/putrescine transport system ATP-binding protein